MIKNKAKVQNGFLKAKDMKGILKMIIGTDMEYLNLNQDKCMKDIGLKAKEMEKVL